MQIVFLKIPVRQAAEKAFDGRRVGGLKEGACVASELRHADADDIRCGKIGREIGGKRRIALITHGEERILYLRFAGRAVKHFDDDAVGRTELQLLRFRPCDPAEAAVFKPPWLTLRYFGEEEAEPDGYLGVFMRKDGVKPLDIQLHAQLLAAFADERSLIGLALLTLSAGEFIHQRTRL